MKIQEDPLCPAGGEKEETSFHFLGECCNNMQNRYSIIGVKGKKVKEVDLYSTFIVVPHTQCAQVQTTQC